MDKNLHKRLLEVCFKNKLHHLGSYFTSVDIIDGIYDKKNSDEIFILSCGHSVVALYVVIEKYLGYDAELLLKKYGEHPKRSEEHDIHCSTGSLGMGITVAAGRALANPNKNYFCLISDGECAEGSVWETLAFVNEHNINNLKIYVNANGWAAYKKVDLDNLEKRLKAFYPKINFVRTNSDIYGLKDQSAHYSNFSEEQFNKAIGEL